MYNLDRAKNTWNLDPKHVTYTGPGTCIILRTDTRQNMYNLDKINVQNLLDKAMRKTASWVLTARWPFRSYQGRTEPRTCIIWTGQGQETCNSLGINGRLPIQVKPGRTGPRTCKIWTGQGQETNSLVGIKGQLPIQVIPW